jgi:hypothetical protein
MIMDCSLEQFLLLGLMYLREGKGGFELDVSKGLHLRIPWKSSRSDR